MPVTIVPGLTFGPTPPLTLTLLPPSVILLGTSAATPRPASPMRLLPVCPTTRLATTFGATAASLASLVTSNCFFAAPVALSTSTLSSHARVVILIIAVPTPFPSRCCVPKFLELADNAVHFLIHLSKDRMVHEMSLNHCNCILYGAPIATNPQLPAFPVQSRIYKSSAVPEALDGFATAAKYPSVSIGLHRYRLFNKFDLHPCLFDAFVVIAKDSDCPLVIVVLRQDPDFYLILILKRTD
mmetsp:Transcript_55656/g.110586  ORF Transcript_55656/g.110586 Transcript_55656/m.110586 type:complete len:241 (+) Transcript_55656:465-1187(+)